MISPRRDSSSFMAVKGLKETMRSNLAFMTRRSVGIGWQEECNYVDHICFRLLHGIFLVIRSTFESSIRRMEVQETRMNM